MTDDPSFRPLFPPYLQEAPEGHDPTRGPSVLAVQGYLIGMDCHADHALVPDGVYGPVMTQAVKQLQEESLGFEDKDADGCFGPATRERVLEEFGDDFAAYPFPPFLGKTTWYNPEGGENPPWPPEDEPERE